MKTITLHPGSALAGAALVVLAGVLSAQQVVPRFFGVVVKGPVEAHVAPHPRDFVHVREGTPYTVPAGKLFVPTGQLTERRVIRAPGKRNPGTWWSGPAPSSSC